MSERDSREKQCVKPVYFNILLDELRVNLDQTRAGECWNSFGEFCFVSVKVGSLTPHHKLILFIKES